jgi:5-dehydro-2-deoxygluconokinase
VIPEVVTVGRVSVDLYPEQTGVRLAEVSTFRKMLGGSPTNVAVAAARLGRSAAVVTKVGDDPFGEYVRAALREFGVDDSLMGTHPTLRTPLAFCELFPPDRFPLLFYRAPKAPDLELEDADFGEVASEAALLWTTGTGLSDEPSRSATLAALRRRGRRPHVVHDLDYRAVFWPSPESARRWSREALEHATVVVGNTEEVAVTLGDELEPESAARRLLEVGPELAIVKRGGDGVLAATRAETVSVPALRIEVVNGLGAGDAFGGALCHGLLAGWELERTLRFANAAGALVASRLGCADDMPTLSEIEDLLCAA